MCVKVQVAWRKVVASLLNGEVYVGKWSPPINKRAIYFLVPCLILLELLFTEQNVIIMQLLYFLSTGFVVSF